MAANFLSEKNVNKTSVRQYLKVLELSITKLCFQNKGEIKTFRHTKIERIHHQQTRTSSQDVSTEVLQAEGNYQMEIQIYTNRKRKLGLSYTAPGSARLYLGNKSESFFFFCFFFLLMCIVFHLIEIQWTCNMVLILYS